MLENRSLGPDQWIMFILMIVMFGGLALHFYLKELKRKKDSAKASFIMKTRFDLETNVFQEPYYFGNLSEASQKLYKRVQDELFEEGIDPYFLKSGLVTHKSFSEWKRLGYIKD